MKAFEWDIQASWSVSTMETICEYLDKQGILNVVITDLFKLFVEFCDTEKDTDIRNVELTDKLMYDFACWLSRKDVTPREQ